MVRRNLIKVVAMGFVFVAIMLWASHSMPVAASTTAVTRYVATTGVNSGACTSSAAPCRTIQYAVNQSVSGDTILVAQGTYTYNSSTDVCSFLQTRSVVCFVDKVLTILGGYTTSNWSSSNPTTNLTVIDGQNTYRGVAVIGYLTTTANLRMEGFTIQNGRAVGPTYLIPYDPSGVGGGMWAQISSVTLRDVIFRNNQVYGATTASGAGGAGAGAALRIESSPAGTSSLLDRVTFDNNYSQGGTGPERGGVAFGALFVYASNVTVQDSTFTNNRCIGGSTTGNGYYGGLHADALGGAIGFEMGTGNLTRLTITGNQAIGGNAGSEGGGGYGAGIFMEDVSYLTITDTSVRNNESRGGNAVNGGFGAGGGILVTDGVGVIERTQVISNTAMGGNSTTGTGNAGPPGGGGVYLWANDTGNYGMNLTNVVIADNLAVAGTAGSGVLGGGGGGIQIQGIPANLTHVTLARNRLGSTLVAGQALLALSSPGVAASVVNVNHSIIADHTTGRSGVSAVLVQTANTVTFNGGLFAGNTKNTNSDGSPMAVGTINGLSTMVSAASASFVSPGSPNYNYRLQTSSVAKNQAVGSSTPNDLDRRLRPIESVADFGAFEYGTSAPTAAFGFLPMIAK